MPDIPLLLPNQPGADYAARLLGDVGIDTQLPPAFTPEHPAISWARSGAMWLTGYDAPLLLSAPLATAAKGAVLALNALVPATAKATPKDFPAEALLGERAAIAGHQRRGAVSCGGSCHLLSCKDGDVALNLARDDDWELLPALLSAHPPERDIPVGDWQALADNLRNQECEHLLNLGAELGLAIADANTTPADSPWFRLTHASGGSAPNRPPRVIDLSSLWAGPLCGSLLAAGGARVIKVESTSRPDGARNGPAAFFDVMNANKESLALNLNTELGIQQLSALLDQADIVIESTRPRALQQMDISAEQSVQRNPGQIWLSITGYGRSPEQANRIAYGDDAGVAAGLSNLLKNTCGRSVFCGDAIADPLTGLHAAVAATALWQQGRGGLLDINLSSVTRYASLPLADTTAWCVESDGENFWVESSEGKQRHHVALPRARRAPYPAAALGANNTSIFSELELPC